VIGWDRGRLARKRAGRRAVSHIEAPNSLFALRAHLRVGAPAVAVLECGDLSPLSSVATCRDAAGDRSPATKAPTGRRTPKLHFPWLLYDPRLL